MINSRFSRVATLYGLFAFVVFAFSFLSVTSFALTTDLIAGQHTVVGQVIVTNDAQYLHVTYQTTGNWYLSATHLDVETDPNAIPQSNGNPIPGKFQYSSTHNPPVTSYTYDNIPAPPAGVTYFIAAHAEVVNGIGTPHVDYDALKLAPSGTYTISIISWGGDSYFTLSITGPDLNGTGYKGFCIQPDPTFILWDQYDYISNVVSSYCSTTLIPVNYPGNLDKVNFILNNYLDKNCSPINGYTFGDIQAAIWYLLTGPFVFDPTPIINGELYYNPSNLSNPGGGLEYVEGELDGNWNKDRALQIIDSTKDLCHEYIPPVDGIMAIIFYNPFSQIAELDFEQYGLCGFGRGQAFLICVHVPTKTCYGCSETAWGKGCDFPGKNWAMYFKYPAGDTGCNETGCDWNKGYNSNDHNGYDHNGYDHNGYDHNGYDHNGYDHNGYNSNGYDHNGYDHNGYDCKGYNSNGYNSKGNKKTGKK